MRRTFLYGLLIVIALAALALYWFANRTIVVGRAMIGPPPGVGLPPPHESLIGHAAPTFSGLDQNGGEIGTSTLHGRVVVVSVWAPWCRPCVEELPRVEREIWRPYQSQIVVVGVALGEEPAKIRDFNRQANLTFPLVADPNRKIARSFGADHFIPQTFVINRAGVVVYETLGYDKRNFGHLVSAVQRAIARQ